MKNWIIFSIVFILSLSLVISVLVFWKADAPYSDMEQKAESFVLDTKALAVVKDSYVYNGNATLKILKNKGLKFRPWRESSEQKLK